MTERFRLCHTCADLFQYGGYRLKKHRDLIGLICQHCRKRVGAGAEYTVTLKKEIRDDA